MIHPEILLKQVPMFRSLRADDCRHIAALLQKHTLRKGDVLFRNGEEGHSLYMITAGKIKIVRQLVEEDFLRQLLTQVQSQGQQALVPNQSTTPAEYRIFDDSSPAHPNSGNNAVEMDLNRNRNQVVDETFHSGIIL